MRAGTLRTWDMRSVVTASPISEATARRLSPIRSASAPAKTRPVALVSVAMV